LNRRRHSLRSSAGEAETLTCLEVCNLGFSAGDALTRGPAGAPLAEIFIADLGAATVEWDCRAYEDTHNTIATRTSKGLKDRRNRRTVRSIDTNENAAELRLCLSAEKILSKHRARWSDPRARQPW